MIRYSNDDCINAFVSSMVGFFEVNPYNFGPPHEDKTIAMMHDAVEQMFGQFARGVRMPTVH